MASGYRNSDLAALHLLSDGEFSLRGFIELNDGHTWTAFTHLESVVREGSSRDHQAVGDRAEGLLQVLS